MKSIKILISMIIRNNKLKSSYFLFFTFIASLLEAFSIALIFPIIIFLLDGNASSYNEFKFLQIDKINFSNYNTIIILLFLLAVIYFIKSFFLIYFQWWKNEFANSLQLKISKKILKKYLYMPFIDAIKINSAVKLRNVLTETPKVRKSFISLMTIIVQISVISILFVVIFIAEPYSALIAITFFSIVFLFYQFLFKNILKIWGEKRLKLSGKVIKSLKDSFSATNEIRTFHKEKYFIDKFFLSEKELLKYIKFFSTFNISPKIILEFFAVLFIIVSIFIMMKLGNDNSKILATIVLIGAAGVRVLPAAASFISCLNELKNSQPSITTIFDILKNNIYKNRKNVDFYALKSHIKIENVYFSYENKIIFNQINFKLHKNKLIGINGVSGSGKSTLINIIIGLLKPQRGNIFYDNNNINDGEFNYKIGYVPQESILLDDTILNNITFEDNTDDYNKIKKLLQICFLEDLVSDSKDGLNSILGENALQISGGQRQRISIARALYFDPDIIILDESFNEIDEKTSEKVLKNIMLNYKDRIIILVSHNKNILSKCDYILNIKDKKVNHE